MFCFLANIDQIYLLVTLVDDVFLPTLVNFFFFADVDLVFWPTLVVSIFLLALIRVLLVEPSWGYFFIDIGQDFSRSTSVEAVFWLMSARVF